MKVWLCIVAFVACKSRIERVPVVEAVVPASVCQDTGASVEVVGSHFDPVPVHVLSDASVRVPAALPLDDVRWVDHEHLQGRVPKGLAAGMHDIVVINPLGASGTLATALEIVIAPTIHSVQVAGEIVVTGADFSPHAQVTLRRGSSLVSLQPHVVSPTELRATLPAEATGTWDLIVSNAEGCRTVALGAVSAPPSNAGALTSIRPDRTTPSQEVVVTITGSGFGGLSDVFLGARALERVSVLSPTTLTALVPAGLALGDYDVIVRTGSEERRLPAGFHVVAGPLARILSVSEALFTAGGGLDFVACGDGLMTSPAFLASLTDATVHPLTASIAPNTLCPPGQSALRLQGGAVPVGTYALHVGSAEYRALFVLAASANPAAVAAAGQMRHARRGAAAATLRNDLGQRFAYVLGGDAPSNDATGLSALEAAGAQQGVEAAALVADDNGRVVLAAPFDLQSTITGRFAPAAVGVESGGHAALFVFGGSHGVLVERALLLREADAPRLVDAALVTGGSVPSGVHRYRIAAKKSASDGYDPSGETLPSDAITVMLATPAGVQLTAALNAVSLPDGSSYTPTHFSIYRDDAWIGEAPCCAFVDDGSSSGGAAPHRSGALGRFVALGPMSTRAGAQASFVASPAPGRLGFFYVSGGNIMRSELKPDFSVGSEVEVASSAPVFHAASVIGSRLYLLFGFVGASLSSAIERYDIGADGALGGHVAQDVATEFAGGAGFSAGSRLYWLYGMNGPGALYSGSRDGRVLPSGELQSWNSGALSPPTERFLPAWVRIGADVFIFGGYGAMTSIDQLTF